MVLPMTTARTPIDRLANRVVRDAIVASDLTYDQVANRLKIARPTLSIRLNRGYTWSLGELVMLSAWLGCDLLRLISDEQNARNPKVAS